jgi:UDP-glucose 4-epimerase
MAAREHKGNAMSKVLINGVGGQIGTRLAQRLSAEPSLELIGLARATPNGPVGRADWLVAHLNGHQLLELLRAEQVDTLVHLDFEGIDAPVSSRETAVQRNIMGTMEVLGACSAAGVRQVVVLSHSLVYGCELTNPSWIRESQPLVRTGRNSLLRGHVEIDEFLIDFAASHTAMRVVTLRCAPLIGGWSPLGAYLSGSAPSMLLGFDPSIQVLHLSDAVEAFALATLRPVAGPFNIASADTVSLSQAIRLVGRQPDLVFEPLAMMMKSFGDRQVLADWPYDRDLLRYGCVVDIARARCELGWSPAVSAYEALQQLQVACATSDAETAEEALRAFLERRH